jgi:hypothetical protein
MAGFLFWSLCFLELIFLQYSVRGNLFELGFLVLDVLARNRIEFGNFDFFRSGALVLGCSVEMARSRRGFELYFFSHGNVLILSLDYLIDTGQVPLKRP